LRTVAHEIDEQSGFEIGFNTLVAGICGANLVHAMSVIGSGAAVCKELHILSEEYIRFTERFSRGIEVDDRKLAVEDIAQVGPGGSFMESELTLSLFRKDIWSPTLFVREYFEKWAQDGRHGIRARLSEECDRVLREHEPVPVEDAKLREIRRIIEASDRERLACV